KYIGYNPVNNEKTNFMQIENRLRNFRFHPTFFKDYIMAAYSLQEVREFKVYNVDKSEQIYLVGNSQQGDINNQFHHLQFCPAMPKCSMVMTYGSHEVRKKYKSSAARAENTGNLTRKCYVEFVLGKSKVMELEPWFCLLSIEVPACIYSKDNHYIPTDNFEHGLEIRCINYINNNAGFIILRYKSYKNDFKGVLGLINMNKDDIDSNGYFTEFSSRFQPIWHDIVDSDSISVSNIQKFAEDSDYSTESEDEESLTDSVSISISSDQLGELGTEIQFMKDSDCISVSNDQQFIVLDPDLCTISKIVVFRVENGLVQSYTRLPCHDRCQVVRLIPSTNQLLVFEYKHKHCIYEYSLQGRNIQWHDIQDSVEVQNVKIHKCKDKFSLANRPRSTMETLSVDWLVLMTFSLQLRN
ncbi:hypothetical protein TrispH2_011925, partial [Trichoplax sp. H2]